MTRSPSRTGLARRSLTASLLGATLLAGTACSAAPTTTGAAPAAKDVKEDVAQDLTKADAAPDNCTVQGTWTLDSAALTRDFADLKLSEAEIDRIPADTGKPAFDVATLTKAYSAPDRTQPLQEYLTNTAEERTGRKIPVIDQQGSAPQSGMSLTTEPDGDVRMDWHMAPDSGGCQGGNDPGRQLLQTATGPLAKLGDGGAAVMSNLIAGVVSIPVAFAVGAAVAYFPPAAIFSGCVGGAVGGAVFASVSTYLYSGRKDLSAINALGAGVAGCLGGAAAQNLQPVVVDRLRQVFTRALAGTRPAVVTGAADGAVVDAAATELTTYHSAMSDAFGVALDEAAAAK